MNDRSQISLWLPAGLSYGIIRRTFSKFSGKTVASASVGSTIVAQTLLVLGRFEGPRRVEKGGR
jgi:hypothetical protein